MDTSEGEKNEKEKKGKYTQQQHITNQYLIRRNTFGLHAPHIHEISLGKLKPKFVLALVVIA